LDLVTLAFPGYNYQGALSIVQPLHTMMTAAKPGSPVVVQSSPMRDAVIFLSSKEPVGDPMHIARGDSMPLGKEARDATSRSRVHPH
jgi:hypothetical protein